MEYVFPTHIHCIGIKGSGVAALTVLLKAKGCHITGSDISDTFYTDDVLRNAGIVWNTGFSPNNIPNTTQLVIYSAAYNEHSNSELQHAKTFYKTLSYPQALGLFSQQQESWAVIGTHGKTSTTTFIGILCKSQNLPASVLTGSALADFDGSAVLYTGDDVFFAEVCEYKNHFLHFTPSGAVFTSAELDHPDYFKTTDHIYKAFASFLEKLPPKACIIACHDDKGVKKTLETLAKTKAITTRWYAQEQKENLINFDVVRIYRQEPEHYKDHKMQLFTLRGLNDYADTLKWRLPVASSVLIDNAVAAILSVSTYMNNHNIPINWDAMHETLANFKGMSRRSELVYKDSSYIIMDDYGHHPTAIEKTLTGIRDFYRPQRLIVNFMSHTYTRTKKFWEEFIKCFSCADQVIVNDIYSSAREDKDDFTEYGGKQLAEALTKHGTQARYIPTIEETIEDATHLLQRGDLYITMGAGDNFRVSHALAEKLQRGTL